jgi:hypothetical protein
MNPLLLGPVLEIGKSLISRLFPDAKAKSKAEADFLVMIQTQEFQKVLSQLEINAAEAASPDPFTSRWRPAVGWCCAAGFLWAAIGQPIFAYVAAIKGWPPAPAIDTDVLMYVLGGMLGLGTLRSVEKVKGAA